MLLHKLKSVLAFLCFVTVMGTVTAGYSQDNTDQLHAWREAAAEGDAEAAVELGETYRNGWGVEKNEDEAFKWYLTAAKRGTDKGVAEFIVGQYYTAGRGVAQNYKEAFDWYKKAAAKGNVAAENNVGVAYFFGRGVAQDKAKAIEAYRSAATRGYADAEFNLAEAYYLGEGVAKDVREAAILYKKAVEKGHAQANKRLMEMAGTTKKMFSAETFTSHWELILGAVLILCCFIFFR